MMCIRHDGCFGGKSQLKEYYIEHPSFTWALNVHVLLYLHRNVRLYTNYTNYTAVQQRSEKVEFCSQVFTDLLID
jgi:IS4 transposase